MAAQYEREKYNQSTAPYSKPVGVGEMIGGLTSAGRGNLVSDSLIIAHPELPPKGSSSPITSPASGLEEKSDSSGILIAVAVGLVALFLIARRT